MIRTTVIVGNIATIIALILLYLEYSGRIEFWDQTTYLWVDTVLCLFMIAEWFILLWLVDDRRAYLKARWIDLLASLPLLLIARPLRIIRLLRVLRLLRGIALVRRAMRPWEAAIDMTILKTAAIAATIVILCASLLVMDLERENSDLNTFGEALWWSVVTSTTVGYGDRVPLTPAGQFVAVLLMILGIGLFGTLAATLTSALTAGRSTEVSNEEVLAEVTRLREQIERLERRLSRDDPDETSGESGHEP
ncbi:MAG: potassium channel protein [Phycisphaerales bacterium]|nr:MAG: potassium channel protein [Phycisphaerales bacterium]